MKDSKELQKINQEIRLKRQKLSKNQKLRFSGKYLSTKFECQPRERNVFDQLCF